MHERIKKLRKFYDLTQQEFADRLGIKRNTVATYEIGRSEPIDAVISLICREFHCSEKWLRTGEGEMIVPTTRNDEIAAFVGRVLGGEPDSFQQRFIAMLARLTESEWELLERKALEITGGRLDQETSDKQTKE